MRVPGQKLFVPAIKRLAGMARSYINTTLIWKWGHNTITIIGWSHRS